MGAVATFRVVLTVEWSFRGEPRLPLPPARVRRRIDGRWELEFEVDGDSFDVAAGRLWGEAAACGLEVVAVGPPS